MSQSRHVTGEASLLRSSLLPVASSMYLALAHSDLTFDSLAEAAMAFFWHCNGVLARIALASLPASSCPCCWRCTSIVAKLAFKGPACATLSSAGVALAFHPHCAGVIASIVLLSLLPALHQRHCPHCVGTFALVALALLPLLLLHHRQHCKLASAQSQSNCNTRWCHCQHCAILVAGIALTSLALLRGRLCPHCAGIAALGTPTSPPESGTGIWPVMTQLQHVAGETLLLHSLSLSVVLSMYLALAHSDLAFNGVAKMLMAFFWRCTGVLICIALVSLPASSCPCCWRCVGIVAKLAFNSLAGTALAFSSIALVFCLHWSVIIVSTVLPLSLLALR